MYQNPIYICMSWYSKICWFKWDKQKINSFFIRKLFDKTLQKSLPRANNFLGYIILSVLTQEQKLDCEEEIFEKELIDALKSFSNNKSSGNDGSTKECYEAFWSELKK